MEEKKDKKKKVTFISSISGKEVFKFKIAKDYLSGFNIDLMRNMQLETDEPLIIKTGKTKFILPPGLSKNTVIKIK